jgi:hypothetical protein
MQVQVYGGLSLAMKRQLREVALAVREGRFETAVPKSRIAAGTRLIRLWQGQTHTVYVHGDGFEWNGSRYRSLSTIAKAITGTNWNGWTFFGVKRGKAGDGRDELGRFRSGADAEGMRDWPRRAFAALLGVVVHELGALLPDAVDVGRFAVHQASVVDARLHPADVVAHDEQDVGLVLRRGGRHTRHGCRERDWYRGPQQTF